jgi:hypothetical protein
VKKRKCDRHDELTQHEEGNVLLANVATSSAPDELEMQYPTSTNITIIHYRIRADLPDVSPYVWNVCKSPMTPPLPYPLVGRCVSGSFATQNFILSKIHLQTPQHHQY